MANRTRHAVPRTTVSRRAALGFLGGVAIGTTSAKGGGEYFDKDKPLIEDIGAAERIGAADALRTLAQQATASACFLAHGVETEKSRAVLIAARQEFRRNYEAVTFGNIGMNIIGKESRSDTIAVLKSIDTAWNDVDPLLQNILENPSDPVALHAVRSNSAPLFASTDKLVSQIAGQYSNPAELIQRDAILINLAGRQGNLTQEIANHACEIWEQESSTLAKDALVSSMQAFEATLHALRHGLPELGLRPAPTEEIAKDLDSVLADWSKTRSLLDKMIGTASFPETSRAEFYTHMTQTSQKLELLVKSYILQAKLHQNR